jgi:CHAT domain-containing protein/tetratricopeptide (TPR) repeat protein
VCLLTAASISARTTVAGLQAEQTAAASSEQVVAWLLSAESFLREMKGEEATVLFEKVIDQAPRLGLDAQHAQALTGLAEILYYRTTYAAARERAQQALEIYERLDNPRGIGRVSHLLSMLSERAGNFAEATRYAQQAILANETAGNLQGRGVATLQLLRVSGSSREPALYNRVIDDARSAGDRLLEARALHAHADHLFAQGEYVASLGKLEAAASLFEAAGDPVALGTVYNSLGRLYRRHGRVDVALTYQLKALALHENSGSTVNIVQSLNAVAVTYQNLADTRNARAYLERAIALAGQSSSPQILDFLRANLSGVLSDEADYDAAARTLEGVVARGLDRFPSTRLGELSETYLRLGRAGDALTVARKAVELCGDGDLECINARYHRAEAYEALGNRQAALDDVRAALKALEAVRSRLIPADFLKQQFGLAQEKVYSRAIALQIDEGHARDALETAELARSRAFIDLLASRDVHVRNDAPAGPPAAAETTADPIGTLPLLFRGSAQHGTETKPAAAPGQQATLPSQVAASAATAAELIGTAGRLQSTLLAYWVTPRQVFIWVVSPAGDIRVAQVDVADVKLRKLIEDATPLGTASPASAIAKRGVDDMPMPPPASTAWRDLYDLLVKPVRAWLPQTPGALVTVVPHGPLTGLAFAALQDGRGRYLLEDYSLHYVPAAAILQFTARQQHPGSRAGNLLLVADPTAPPVSKLDPTLPRLPGARTEARAVSNLMPRARAVTLEGAAATEPAVRSAVGGKAILHFASHAIVRDDDPFSSFLAVAPSSRDRDADGFLTAQEIYGLKLDADLVVLSACRSAAGRVTGDGVATFARAFIYAGTPSLVASMWDVADAPTSRLVPDFYRSWLAGSSKARALRTAQLSLLRDLRANKVRIETPAGMVSLPEHPVFWAGFALFGEPK